MCPSESQDAPPEQHEMAEKRLKQVTYRPMRRHPTLAWERDHEGRRWLVLYCDNQLRKQWPNPLAEEW